MRTLSYVLTFVLGAGAMSMYGGILERTQKAELERVTIMRPIAHEAVPKPVDKLPEITPTTAPASTTSIPATSSASETVSPTLAASAANPTNTTATSKDTGTVEFVYDGDTVRLADKRKVRLIGIDSPEMNYGKGEPECYAREAKRALESLVLKKEVSLVADKEDKDRYGRLLRYVYVSSPSGDIFTNNALVQTGAAYAKRYPPNTTNATLLEESMQKAQADKVGMWNVCK